MCDAYVPVPDSVTICALVKAESLIVKVPVKDPAAVGEKVTSMVQVLPVVSSLGQVLVSAKSPAILMLVIFSGVAPGLLRVTTCAALLVPTACPAKVRLLGAKPITGSFNSTLAEPRSPSVDPLSVARSKPPSALKSAATIPYGKLPVVSVTRLGKVPSPWPGINVTNPGFSGLTIVTARSTLPSLLKSPATTE